MSTSRELNIEVGKKYYRKRGVCGAVRLVLAVEGDRVRYRVLHGPALKRQPDNACSLKNFAAWADGAFEGEDYHRLDGAKRFGTFLVQSVAGRPIFRCSDRRGRFYLRKGYAVKVDEGTLRFIDDTTEKKLAYLYDGELSAFFLEVKNDRCVVCGKDHGLTRHHVVPRRHKRKLPPEVRQRISNILFICVDCHRVYEEQQLVSESTDPYVWKDHFLDTMKPRFLPRGWDIFLARRSG
jgi:hypothetical protein